MLGKQSVFFFVSAPQVLTAKPFYILDCCALLSVAAVALKLSSNVCKVSLGQFSTALCDVRHAVSVDLRRMFRTEYIDKTMFAFQVPS